MNRICIFSGLVISKYCISALYILNEYNSVAIIRLACLYSRRR